MSHIHRTGLIVAGLAAVLMVAGTLVADGYQGAQRAAAIATSGQQGTPTETPTDSTAPETIYVNPAPTPDTVTITNTAPPQPGSQGTAPVIHVVVPNPAGGDDGAESGGDD